MLFEKRQSKHPSTGLVSQCMQQPGLHPPKPGTWDLAHAMWATGTQVPEPSPAALGGAPEQKARIRNKAKTQTQALLNRMQAF